MTKSAGSRRWLPATEEIHALRTLVVDDLDTVRELVRSGTMTVIMPSRSQRVTKSIGKAASEMFERHFPIARPTGPDHPVKNPGARIVPNLRHGDDRGFEIQHLAVEQEGVHVENDSLRTRGKFIPRR